MTSSAISVASSLLLFSAFALLTESISKQHRTFGSTASALLCLSQILLLPANRHPEGM
jgi:hypothetical protein